MEIFDKEGNMKFILEEIKKTDTFYSFFTKEFSELIYTKIHEFYPDSGKCSEIDEMLQSYAVAILNAAESVIDKDRNYPFYRLEEELATMNRLTKKLSEEGPNNAFGEAVHLQAKELLVKYFTGIYDLSSTGFRLLEKNAKLYNWEFVSNFETIVDPSFPFHQ
jgi:hypothetical protein